MNAQLKAPTTADFPWYDEAFITWSSQDSVTFSAYVDAQNSFGAQIRTNWLCTANRTGRGWAASAYVQGPDSPKTLRCNGFVPS